MMKIYCKPSSRRLPECHSINLQSLQIQNILQHCLSLLSRFYTGTKQMGIVGRSLAQHPSYSGASAHRHSEYMALRICSLLEFCIRHPMQSGGRHAK